MAPQRDLEQLIHSRLWQVVVDLRGNGFGNAGAAALATALKQHANEHLTELDIGYNEIKDDGACAIAQVLRIWIAIRI